jgi:ribosome maturation factor RimP
MKYDLIVSSPGLDRPLRDINECLRFKGRLAKFILKEPLENRTVLKGYIQDVRDDTVSILESDSKKVFTFDFSKVKKANLEIDL